MGQPQGQALRGEGLLTNFGVHDGDTLFFKDLGALKGCRLNHDIFLPFRLLVLPLYPCFSINCLW